MIAGKPFGAGSDPANGRPLFEADRDRIVGQMVIFKPAVCRIDFCRHVAAGFEPPIFFPHVGKVIGTTLFWVVRQHHLVWIGEVGVGVGDDEGGNRFHVAGCRMQNAIAAKIDIRLEKIAEMLTH